MATVQRFANTLPFCGVKDGHDALVVALHSCMIENGYKCIGLGEQVPEGSSNITTEGLPQGWNDSQDFYAIQYKLPSSYERKFLMKILRLDSRLAVHVLDVNKERSCDLTVDTTDYVTADNELLLKNLFNHSQVVKKLQQLEQLFKSNITSKLEAITEKDKGKGTDIKQIQSEPSRSTSRQVVYPDDPLRLPPRRPQGSLQGDPLIRNPYGFGDADRLPGHPGAGGMVIDPFRQWHRRPENDFGHPGLPRGAVPPGARFDPIGPIPPNNRNPRSGRFGGPGPDHLQPPGFEDDMFM